MWHVLIFDTHPILTAGALLLYGFLASDIWSLNREAGGGSLAETEALARIANIAAEIVG